MMDTTEVQETSTTTAQYSTATYGSGSWYGNSGYDSCVNQCIAQYGQGMASSGGGDMSWSYQANQTSGSGGSSGSGGATHTVVVAPHKGVFRFVPFATNASVGDTVEFHWGADNHTVTKSSALTPCNKSTDAPVFASGEQNDGFVFSQVVNDTAPIYYYCGTPGHCEQGMFGVVNPAQTAPGAPSSYAVMLSSMASSDADLAAYAAYSNNLTANNEGASSWGDNMDMSVVPQWAQSLFATNVMYTKNVIAKNPDILAADNAVDLSGVAATPLLLPMDIQNALANSAAPASNTAAAPSDAAPAGAAAASAPASSSPSGNGASSLASPRVLVAAFVVVATFFAL